MRPSVRIGSLLGCMALFLLILSGCSDSPSAPSPAAAPPSAPPGGGTPRGTSGQWMWVSGSTTTNQSVHTARRARPPRGTYPAPATAVYHGPTQTGTSGFSAERGPMRPLRQASRPMGACSTTSGNSTGPTGPGCPAAPGPIQGAPTGQRAPPQVGISPGAGCRLIRGSTQAASSGCSAAIASLRRKLALLPERPLEVRPGGGHKRPMDLDGGRRHRFSRL